MAKEAVQNLNVQPVNERDNTHLLGRLSYYLNPFDARYEDLRKGDWTLCARFHSRLVRRNGGHPAGDGLRDGLRAEARSTASSAGPSPA